MDHMDLPPCMIFIDKEGRWYHEGAEMIHRDIIRLFYENMALDSEDRYVITWRGQHCYVEVEDTAFVVMRTAFVEDGPSGKGRYVLSLSDDTVEALRPEGLFVGRENVLYCRIKGDRFPARFARAAYYQLAQYVEEDCERFYLPLNGRKYEIRMRPGS